MSANDPRYADINDESRVYPALGRAAAHGFALKLLRHLGSPSDAAVRDDGYGGDRNATRADLMRIYRRWTNGGTTGRRCWASTKPSTGHHKGWGRLIHDVSHMVHQFRHPKARPHEHGHAAIERDALEYVLAHGWLESLARPLPSIEDRHATNIARTDARIKRWETKLRRAANALRKLRARKKRLERRKELEVHA